MRHFGLTLIVAYLSLGHAFSAETDWPGPRRGGGSLLAGEGVEPGAPGSGVVPDLKIQFASNSAELGADARATLDALAEAMNREELRGLRFEVAGHTDAKGSDKYNQELSQRRARAVVNYLVRVGKVDPERLVVVGYGESRLINPDNPSSAANRRIEIRPINRQIETRPIE